MTCAQGARSKFYVKDATGDITWTAGTVYGYEFLAESMKRIGTVVHPNGIRGTRSRTSERARLGPYRVMGTILLNIDPLMLDTWLPRMLGTAESTDSFVLSETLPGFGMLFDRVTTNFEYRDCYVNRWVLRGQANQYGAEPQPLQLALEIIGKTQETGVTGPTEAGVSTGLLPTSTNTAPFIFEDSVLLLNAISRPLLAFELSGSNFLQVRFTNSLTATDICPQDREISLRVTVPFTSDVTALLESISGGIDIAGYTGSLAITNSTISKALTFTFGNVKIPNNDPSVRGKQEITMDLDLQIYRISTTLELATTSTS